MGNRTVSDGGTRTLYVLLAIALVASLVQVISVAPAHGVAGDLGPTEVPGASTAGLESEDGQWDTKNQHRTWYVDGRWDAILPMATVANGGPASVESAWWIMKDAIPGAYGVAPTAGIEVSTTDSDRPDIYWDGSSLYVLMSGAANTQFYRYTYNAGTYTLASGPTTLDPDMESDSSRAAIYKDPNGDLWASVMHEGGLLVSRSTDDGASWLEPTTLIFPVGEGQTQITSYSGTHLAVAAAEDGDNDLDGGRYSRYLFYTLDLANVANWNAVDFASGTLSMPLNPINGETITIGGRTYTFRTVLTAAAGDVLIGANVAATQFNLEAAFSGEGTPGVQYTAATIPHDTVFLGAFSANNSPIEAKESGVVGNAIVTTETMLGVGNQFAAATLTGGASPWVSETIPLSQGSVGFATLHSDDELSLVKDSSDNIYIATETQRTGDLNDIELDAQVILYKRTPAGVWTQSNVKMDQSSSTGDRKRPVVAIMDSTIYVIAIDNPRSNSAYWSLPLSSLPSNSWGSTTPLFATEFEAYRNNIVPRDPVTTAQRLPILIDWAWEDDGDDNTIWQTSLPNSTNQAPGAFAGADKTVAASPAADLLGTITNDGLGGPVNWSWSVVSGGAVNFTSPSGACSATVCQLPTTAAFAGGLGTYVLRLTATETGPNPLSNVDEVTITVNALQNTPPVLTVSNPDSGDSAAQGEDVVFEASANDAQDGDISGAIVWTSNRDGIIGFGGFFVKNDLTLGTHTIVANVSDGQNAVSSPNITLTITTGGGGPGPGPGPGSGTFIDDDGHVFEAAIEWLAAEGITKGCNPPKNDRFCPDDNVSRGQMAAFLVRAFGYTDNGGGDLFNDDDNSVFEAAIDKLATAGVTKGCNPPSNTNFCPEDNVTREQMAAFLVRAFDYTNNGGGDLFIDDNNSVFENAIDKLATAGVTKGCNPPTNNRFCPSNNVTRGQMAAFLKRAFGG